MKAEWTYDTILRGWRFTIALGGTLYRTAAVVSRGPAIEFALADELRRKAEGKPVRFQQTGDTEYTLPAGY